MKLILNFSLLSKDTRLSNIIKFTYQHAREKKECILDDCYIIKDFDSIYCIINAFNSRENIKNRK